MSRSVTNGLDNERFPYISANGRAMIYVVLDTYKNKWNLYYAHQEGGDWKRGEEVTIVNKNTNLLYTGGYCLSPDGNTIYFTTKKYNGVGGYDIFYTKRYNANDWTTPVSLGKPVNSEVDDINPSMSSDGEMIYFARCSKATEGETECCKIMVAERLQSGENFDEPKELPSSINTGCESSPRILPDDETLIFSSKRAGGKGGHDFYFVQKDHYGKWGQPKNMSFINTSQDDRFISVDVYSQFFYTDLKEEESSYDIYKVMFPDGFKPHNVISIEGKVVDKVGQPIKSRVQVFDAETKERIHFVAPDEKGEYWFLLTEGHLYDFSIQALEGNHTFESELLDLKVVDKYRREKRDATLSPLKKGSALNLDVLVFDEKGSYLPSSLKELERVGKFLREDPTRKLEFLLYKSDYKEDSVKSPALTEVRYDTIRVIKNVEEIIKVETLVADSIVVSDSTVVKKVEQQVVKKVYHNDLRQKMIRSLKTYFREYNVEDRVVYNSVKATDPRVAIHDKKNKEGVVVVVK